MLISLVRITPDFNNVRKEVGDVSELVESIKHHGLLQPIGVKPDADGFQIVYGHRRFEAFKQAFGMDVEIECTIIKAQREEDIRAIQLTENIQREDVHPLHEAFAINQLREAGKSFQAIGAIIGKSVPYVRKRLGLMNLTETMQERFLKGDFGTDVAVQMAQMPVEFQEQNANVDADRFNFNTRLYIEQAQFDIKDCITCQFNTNVNNLFPEFGEGALCKNKGCFEAKTASYRDEAINVALSKFQYFVNGDWGTMDKAIKKILTDNNKVILERHTYSVIEEPELPEFDEDNDEEYRTEKMEIYTDEIEQYKEDLPNTIDAFCIGGGNRNLKALKVLLQTTDFETKAVPSVEDTNEDHAQVLLAQNIQRLEDECKRQMEGAHTSHLRNLDDAFTDEVIEKQLNLGKGNGDKQLYNKAMEAFRIYIMDEYGIKDLHLNPFDLITIYMLKKYKHEYVADIELPHMKSIAEIVNPEYVLQAEGVMLAKIEHIQKEYNSKIEPLKAKLK